MIQFIIKSIIITICLIILSFFWVPRYEFVSTNCRGNHITGKVEYKTNPGDWN